MKLRNAIGAGLVSVSAVAGLVSPAYAAQAATLKVDKCAVHANIAHPHAGRRDAGGDEHCGRDDRAGNDQVQDGHARLEVQDPQEHEDHVPVRRREPDQELQGDLAGKVTVVPKGYKTGSTCSTSFVPE